MVLGALRSHAIKFRSPSHTSAALLARIRRTQWHNRSYTTASQELVSDRANRKPTIEEKSHTEDHTISSLLHESKTEQQPPSGASFDPRLEKPQPNLQEPSPEPTKLSEALRNALRAIPHPVAVITAGPVLVENPRAFNPREQAKEGHLPSPAQPLSRLQGLLVSSFQCVTLFPEPYVSFNVKLPSSTWDAIVEKQDFQIHLMHDIGLSHEFSKGSLGNHDRGEPKPPEMIINELKQGSLFRLNCTLSAYHEVGDHLLIVGKVLDSTPLEQLHAGSTSLAEALLWKRGAWHIAKPK